MSEYTLNIEYLGRDIEIVYDFDGSYDDAKDGGFDLSITAVYPDVDFTSKQGKDIIDDYDEDELCQLVCDNVDLSALAIEDACGHAEYLRDMAQDR